MSYGHLMRLQAEIAQRAIQLKTFSLKSKEYEKEIEAARKDPNAFVEFCFQDEHGRSYKQAKHHREWQSLFGEPRVSILGHAESGKTTQVAFRLIFDLGHNPELRCFIVSAQMGAASKIVGVIKRNIEENERVRWVFPNLLPGDTWNSHSLLIKGRKSLSTKDFSVQAYGWNSRFLGIRADRLLADDINDFDNSRTADSRQKIIDNFDQKVQTRLTSEGRVWVIGNAWNKDDLVHTLGRRDAFEFRRYSVLNDNGLKSAWPEQFPLKRIATLRRSFPPLAFARAYMCLPLDDESSRFDTEWFERAKERGAGVEYDPDTIPVDSYGVPLMIFCAVDLASGRRGRRRKNDSTSLFTIGYSKREKTFRVLQVQSGNWRSPEIVDRMKKIKAKWDPVFVVEDNGQQQLFIDSRDLAGLRVVGLTTTGMKWDPITGVEGMAIAFNEGKWIIPAELILDANGQRAAHPAIEQWLDHLETFNTDTHTDDDVMASWIGVRATAIYSRSYFSIRPRHAA